MKNLWIILCSNAIIDKASNNMTLANIIEEINIHGRPGKDQRIPFSADLITLWTRDDPKVPESLGYSKITLLSPSKEVVGTWDLEINLAKHRKYRSILKFQSLPLNEEGDYKFLVESRSSNVEEWEKAEELLLQVQLTPLSISEEE